MSVQILEKEVDQDAIADTLATDKGVFRYMANLDRQGDTLFLKQVHIYGDGPNTVGIRAIRQAVQQLGRSLGVKRIVIDGGQRVTGAATSEKGTGPRMPRQLIFDVEEP